jgi:TPR repeat protein
MSDELDNESDLDALRRAYDDLRSDPSRALLQLRDLADRGSVMSMIYLGYARGKGIGSPVDLAEAEKWFKGAYDAGST